MYLGIKMIIIKDNCNIFDGGAQAIVHQANCFNTMGSGIAKQIRERYPEAYAADCMTERGDRRKLGHFSWTKTGDGKFHIYNCYSQYEYGRERRHTNYEAIFTGLTDIKAHAESHGLTTLSLPHMMGCMLGGGSWRIVAAIIDEIFSTDPEMVLYICKYNP